MRRCERAPHGPSSPARLAGFDIPVNLITNLQSMIFGALIVFFLIVEPNGLARLWAIGKEKLRLWPFPH